MKTVLKIVLVLLLLIVIVLAALPWVAPFLGLSISYDSMLGWVVPTEKVEAPKNPLLEGEVPKSFDAVKCDELLDLNKFPDTPLNGTLYKNGEAVDVVMKSGQARIEGETLMIKLFSSDERASCQETKADGSTPDDLALVLQLDKSQVDKGEGAALKYGWDLFGSQALEYFYIVSEKEIKQPIAGLVGGITAEEKAGGTVKGKGIFCFAQPSSDAPPPPKPEDFEEGDPLPPAGIRHALAGNFTVEFCP